MNFSTKHTGNRGEELTANYLKACGYQILQRNYYTAVGEIDIIAEKNGVIYFVEVKSLSNASTIAPATKVNARKRGRIAKTATLWMQEQGQEVLCEFMTAEVFLASGEIHLIRDLLL